MCQTDRHLMLMSQTNDAEKLSTSKRGTTVNIDHSFNFEDYINNFIGGFPKKYCGVRTDSNRYFHFDTEKYYI